jgi:hypothetical protein
MDAKVEIFKTNVADESTAEQVINSLLELIPEARINFDLEDCDKILRIEHLHIPIFEIENLLMTLGYSCQVLM